MRGGDVNDANVPSARMMELLPVVILSGAKDFVCIVILSEAKNLVC